MIWCPLRTTFGPCRRMTAKRPGNLAAPRALPRHPEGRRYGDHSAALEPRQGRSGQLLTRAACHRHARPTLAPFGLVDGGPLFLAATSVPSMEHSDRSRLPRSRGPAASAVRMGVRVPSRTHASQRQTQVSVRTPLGRQTSTRERADGQAAIPRVHTPRHAVRGRDVARSGDTGEQACASGATVRRQAT